MILVITPPRVSRPSDSGVTSSSRTSLTSPLSTAACTAAPSATTSSGLTDMFGSLPPVSRRTRFCTAGMRVEPPTRITSSMALAVSLASAIAWPTGPVVRSTRSAVMLSKVERMIVAFRCFGPDASAVMNGRLTMVWVTAESSTLAFSAAPHPPRPALRVGAQVDAVVPLELIGQVVDQPAVEIVAAQVGVAGRGAHLDHPVADVEDAHVERAAAQVEHQDGLVLLLVKPVRERGRRRLVDDPQHLEARDPAGVLGRLPLGVVEVRGHRDHRLGDLLAEALRRIIDELAQHQRGDLLGRVLPAVNVEPDRPVRARYHVEGDRVQLALHLVEPAADEPLGRVDRPLGVQDRLAPGQLADQPLPLRGEGDHRGGGP